MTRHRRILFAEAVAQRVPMLSHLPRAPARGVELQYFSGIQRRSFMGRSSSYAFFSELRALSESTTDVQSAHAALRSYFKDVSVRPTTFLTLDGRSRTPMREAHGAGESRDVGEAG